MIVRSSPTPGATSADRRVARDLGVDLELVDGGEAYTEDWPDPEYDELTSFEVEQLEQDRDEYLDEVHDEMTMDRREAHTLGIDLDPVADEPLLD